MATVATGTATSPAPASPAPAPSSTPAPAPASSPATATPAATAAAPAGENARAESPTKNPDPEKDGSAKKKKAVAEVAEDVGEMFVDGVSYAAERGYRLTKEGTKLAVEGLTVAGGVMMKVTSTVGGKMMKTGLNVGGKVVDVGGKVGADMATSVTRAFAGNRQVQEVVVDREALRKMDEDLAKACREGRISEVKRLLDAGAHANGVPQGLIPLQCAVEARQLECARLMCEAKANIDMTNANHPLPALCVAASQGNYEISYLLLSHRADIHYPSTIDGSTPLHLAVKNGQIDVTRLLLERGADPTRTDKEGRVPADLVPPKHESAASLLKALKDAEPRDRSPPRKAVSKSVAPRGQLLPPLEQMRAHVHARGRGRGRGAVRKKKVAKKAAEDSFGDFGEAAPAEAFADFSAFSGFPAAAPTEGSSNNGFGKISTPRGSGGSTPRRKMVRKQSIGVDGTPILRSDEHSADSDGTAGSSTRAHRSESVNGNGLPPVHENGDAVHSSTSSSKGASPHIPATALPASVTATISNAPSEGSGASTPRRTSVVSQSGGGVVPLEIAQFAVASTATPRKKKTAKKKAAATAATPAPSATPARAAAADEPEDKSAFAAAMAMGNVPSHAGASESPNKGPVEETAAVKKEFFVAANPDAKLSALAEAPPELDTRAALEQAKVQNAIVQQACRAARLQLIEADRSVKKAEEASKQAIKDLFVLQERVKIDTEKLVKVEVDAKHKMENEFKLLVAALEGRLRAEVELRTKQDEEIRALREEMELLKNPPKPEEKTDNTAAEAAGVAAAVAESAGEAVAAGATEPSEATEGVVDTVPAEGVTTDAPVVVVDAEGNPVETADAMGDSPEATVRTEETAGGDAAAAEVAYDAVPTEETVAADDGAAPAESEAPAEGDAAGAVGTSVDETLAQDEAEVGGYDIDAETPAGGEAAEAPADEGVL